ncbi:MAG: hypothetical protein H0U57_03650 [Tatlockia sp.]|nr:hypothetical protein [Tatlockia sp.]
MNLIKTQINLKEILLKIGRLPKADQRWILSKLSASQKNQFCEMQGEQLLAKAHRFRSLKSKRASLPNLPIIAPPHMHALAAFCPLYVAILLEQGQFSWRQQFLDLFDKENKIKNLDNSDELNQLSKATKQVLLKLWEKPFADYLEINHG